MSKALKRRDKLNIEAKSFKMTGTKREISVKLAKEYGLTPRTIQQYMHPKFNSTPKSSRVQPDEEKRIQQAYDNHEAEKRVDRIKDLMVKFGRSECTIRTIVNKVAKGNVKEEVTYFNPRVFQF